MSKNSENFIDVVLTGYYRYEVGLLWVRKVIFYGFNEFNHGMYAVYEGIHPVAFCSYLPEINGSCLTEINNLSTKHNLYFFGFLNNIIKKGTNGFHTLKPQTKSRYSFFLLLPYEETGGTKSMTLPYYNLDSIWKNLTDEDIRQLIKKTPKN